MQEQHLPADTREIHRIMGKRLETRRIRFNLTQAELAKAAGIGKRTLERLESGETVQSVVLLKVLQQLDLLEPVLHAIPRDEPGPMDLLEHGMKNKRRRVRKSPKQSLRKPEPPSPGVSAQEAGNWIWGDEQ